MNFGETLINIREKHKMSRKELAERLEIPYTTLRNYETNQREPGHEFLIKLSRIFSVSIDYLLGLPEKGIYVTDDDLSLNALHVAQAFDLADSRIQNAVCALLDLPLPNEEQERKNA